MAIQGYQSVSFATIRRRLLAIEIGRVQVLFDQNCTRTAADAWTLGDAAEPFTLNEAVDWLYDTQP